MNATDDDLLRKIYFYRIAHWNDIKADLQRDIERITNLAWDAAGRYLLEADGNRLGLWPDSPSFPLRLKFGRTRLGNLPLKEQAGKLDILDLAADQGLVELCHIVIYPDGYAASEFNFSGPRIKRLSEYLYVKRNELKDTVVFLPLFQRDIVSLVEQMSTITIMEITGQPAAASLLREADQGLSDALQTLGQVGAEKSVRLGLFSDGGHKSKLHTLAIRLANLVLRRRAEVETTLRKLRVQGFNAQGNIDAVDLLEQHLISFKLIERVQPDSKALSSESAYAQIDAAYEELKPILKDASIAQELFDNA